MSIDAGEITGRNFAVPYSCDRLAQSQSLRHDCAEQGQVGLEVGVRSPVVDPDEDPAVTAAREVEEETGWRPKNVKPLVSLQPSVGTTDAENLLFIAHGADHIGNPTDINEAERIAWIPLTSIHDRIHTGEIVGAASLVGLLHVLAFA